MPVEVKNETGRNRKIKIKPMVDRQYFVKVRRNRKQKKGMLF